MCTAFIHKGKHLICGFNLDINEGAMQPSPVRTGPPTTGWTIRTKQTGPWATRVSFVYHSGENAVYYCLQGDFDRIRRHSFG